MVQKYNIVATIHLALMSLSLVFTYPVFAQVPDTNPPTVPSGLNATVISSSQINLSWTASTDNVGVTVYQISRNGSIIATINGSLTTYQNTGLSAGTAYTYTVRALDAANNPSPFSGSVVATTQSDIDTQAPSVPVGLTATAISSSQINLSWTASTDNVGVTAYQLAQNGSIITTVIGGATTYSNTGLTAGTAYSYTVRALDAATNASSFSSPAIGTTQGSGGGGGSDTQAPSTPTSLTATVISSSQVDLSWAASTDNVGVTAYQLARDASIIATITGGATTYQNTGLTAGTVYSYSVRALDAATNISSFSALKSATTLGGVSDTEAPSLPTNLSASITSSKVTLNWTASADATAYFIYRDGDLIGVTDGSTSYIDTSLTSRTSYTYTVRAQDTAGNMSGPSLTIVAKTSDGSSVAKAKSVSKPNGVFSASGAGDSEIYENENLNGVLIRVNWSALEASPGVFDFALIDQIVSKVKAEGKQWSLGVVAGQHAPAWIIDSLDVPYVDYSFRGVPGYRLPLFWDPIVQDRITTMAAAIGERYNDDADLVLVYVSQMTSNGIEGHLSGVDMNDFKDAGYTTSVWVDAAEAATRSFAVAFPDKPIAFEVHEIDNSATAPSRILDRMWDDVTLKGQVGAAVWWHSGRTTYQSDLVEVLENYEGNIYGQLIAESSDETREDEFGIGGFSSVFTQARDLDMCYIEAWESEFKTGAGTANGAWDDAFADFNTWTENSCYSKTETVVSTRDKVGNSSTYSSPSRPTTLNSIQDSQTSVLDFPLLRNLQTVLVTGSEGDEVAELQKFLIEKGYLSWTGVLGYFGQLTAQAVKDFQCAQNILCVNIEGWGIVGPRTRAKIQELLDQEVVSIESTVSAVLNKLTRPLFMGIDDRAEVSLLQSMLTQDSQVYPEGMITGFFGPLTKKAVTAFQVKHNLIVNDPASFGLVGPKTRLKLNELYGK